MSQFAEVYEHLKDFQRTTVDYVFQRMYLDEQPTRRFLVADEVGLGKTLVARGVIARAVEHLQERGVKRIDVVYICSTGDIARQNIRRLSLPGFADSAFASRLTLLPLQLRDLNRNRLNFVSFTPGTAFELKSSLGIMDERALLYRLLKKKWPHLVGIKKGPMRVFQGYATSLPRFKEHYDYMLRNSLKRVDRGLERRFSDAVDLHDAARRAAGQPTLEDRFADLADRWAYAAAGRDQQNRADRDRFVGDLRALLARTCIGALEPDLVILDEFQRFKNLLHGESEASRLAHELFDYADADAQARVLMLSATPSKMYTLTEEREDDDHFADFIGTASFLLNGRADTLRADLSDMQRHLLHLDPDNLDPLIAAKTRVETTLRSVMCRTERLASSVDRNGMLREAPNGAAAVTASDLLSYVTLDRAAHQLDAAGQVEFWKSAPYFPNFWHDYQIGRRYQTAIDREWDAASTVQSLLSAGEHLIPWDDIRRYRRIDPGNARLRGLISDLDKAEAWKLLWLPPSLPYHRLSGPFRAAFDLGFTKRLVFSAWGVVPKVVSTLVSYDAERRMMTAPGKAKVVQNTADDRAGLAEPFRFPTARTSAMTAFVFVYPSQALAQLTDPKRIAAELATSGKQATRSSVLAAAEQTLEPIVAKLVNRHQSSDSTDDRWYWATPILMDADQEWPFPNGSAWLVEGSRSGGAGFDKHLELARATHADPASLGLGRPPKDLVKVLALLGTAGPANCALRAFGRVPPDAGRLALFAAAKVAWSFRSLFNTPEVTQLIRGIATGGAYWRKALRYCSEGCLQSVLDEYLAVLPQFVGLTGTPGPDDLDSLAGAIDDAVTLRSADLQARDPLDPEDPVRRMRCHFALPFGNFRGDDDKRAARTGNVKAAFNSPFWPFLLTTTSIGQEGLDFHLYCHAVVHWNLPANPVDLEQREGRVHRYLGHAVRKNLATRYMRLGIDANNPWQAMIDQAVADRGNETDLVPYWVFPGPAHIERHVPMLPLSREETRITDLRRSVALYRLVFGQARQEELIRLLRTREDGHLLEQYATIDLLPTPRRAHV
jgi:hypothetical protein